MLIGLVIDPMIKNLLLAYCAFLGVFVDSKRNLFTIIKRELFL